MGGNSDEIGGISTANTDAKPKLAMCRVCLTFKHPLVSLFQYRPNVGSYAEILTTFTNVKVSSNDGFTDKICIVCGNFIERVMKFKRVAESSDRKLRAMSSKNIKKNEAKKIRFDNLQEIKREIVKSEAKVKLEIEVLDQTFLQAEEDKKDVVIYNTVIKKIEPSTDNIKPQDSIPTFAMESHPQINIKSNAVDENAADSDGNDFFNNGGDDSDEDYIPLAECKKKKVHSKSIFKKPKIPDVKSISMMRHQRSKHRKTREGYKVIRRNDADKVQSSIKLESMDSDGDKTGNYITCYPLMKNGQKGPPLVLKRPKDATVLKSNPNYKPRLSAYLKRNPSVQVKPKPKEKPNVPQKGPRIVRTVTLKPKEKLVCPVCGVLTYGLGNHMATHQEKKRYPCPTCNRSFAQKNNMVIHFKTHSGVKDHICEICGAGFYCPKSLQRHNLIHKGERPFACNLCPKTFIARCDLNRHLRIHSGYKPFKCSECSMSFNAKHQLQNHERMHTGEKPYTCQVCNVAFSYKVNLNNHVYKVHGVNLKFKSIHTITEEVLGKELQMMAVTRPNTHNVLHESNDEKIPPSSSHANLY